MIYTVIQRGDELLIFVAGMLKRIFADQLVVRMGGDEFCILCNGEIAIGIEESQFLDSRAKMMDTVDKLKELGIRIAINNFGSASSIKVLQDSASKILKLDKKLIEAAEESEAGQLILRNVVSLGRDLYCTMQDYILTDFRYRHWSMFLV